MRTRIIYQKRGSYETGFEGGMALPHKNTKLDDVSQYDKK